MPRHTHPRPCAKHSRQHVRAQRERYIARRFATAKADAGFSLRFDPDPRVLADEAAAAAIRAVLAANYENPNPAAYTGGQGWPHPELVRQLPAWVLKVTGDAAAYGQMADRPGFWIYCTGCNCCKPYRYQPGYRARVRRTLSECIEDGLAEHADGENLDGRLVSEHRERAPVSGWC